MLIANYSQAHSCLAGCRYWKVVVVFFALFRLRSDLKVQGLQERKMNHSQRTKRECEIGHTIN